MTSRAAITAPGWSRRSWASLSPASLRAIVSGVKTVWKTGTSSLRPSRMSRSASSSRPRAPCPGSSGLSFAQSPTSRTAGWVQGLAPLGAPPDATGPVPHATDAARHPLDEVRVPTPLEGQHGIGQAPGGVVHIGNVSPESHRQTIHRLSTESSQDALALCHRVGSLSFSSRGTFSTRYGLTVREGDAADAPQFLERLRAGD